MKLTTNGRTDEAEFTKNALLASLDLRLGDRWTVGMAGGTTTVGMLRINQATYALTPGPVGVVAASFRPVDEGSARPFVVVAGSFGASLLWTKLGNRSSDSMSAFDGRIGVAAGKTIGGVVSPYVLARAFGGPVLWTYQGASSTGTDVYHYQLGVGLVVRSGAFDAAVEGVPLGERAVVAGMGVGF